MGAEAPAANPKDQAKKFILPSGATLHVSRPSYVDAAALRNSLIAAFGSAPLSADEMKVTLDQLRDAPSTGGALLQRGLKVLSSAEVERYVFACLKTALYFPAGSEDGIKVNQALFDHGEHGDAARTDYYVLCFRAAEVAVQPFLGALFSMYREFRQKIAGAPASPSSSDQRGS